MKDPRRTSVFSPKLVTPTFLASIAFKIEVPSADVVGGPLAGARRVRPAAEAWLSRHRAARMQAVRSMLSDVDGWRQGVSQIDRCVLREICMLDSSADLHIYQTL